MGSESNGGDDNRGSYSVLTIKQFDSLNSPSLLTAYLEHRLLKATPDLSLFLKFRDILSTENSSFGKSFVETPQPEA